MLQRVSTSCGIAVSQSGFLIALAEMKVHSATEHSMFSRDLTSILSIFPANLPLESSKSQMLITNNEELCDLEMEIEIEMQASQNQCAELKQRVLSLLESITAVEWRFLANELLNSMVVNQNRPFGKDFGETLN